MKAWSAVGWMCVGHWWGRSGGAWIGAVADPMGSVATLYCCVRGKWVVLLLLGILASLGTLLLLCSARGGGGLLKLLHDGCGGGVRAAPVLCVAPLCYSLGLSGRGFLGTFLSCGRGVRTDRCCWSGACSTFHWFLFS